MPNKQAMIDKIKYIIREETEKALELPPPPTIPITRENKLTPEKTSVSFLRGQPMAKPGEHIRGTIVHMYKFKATEHTTIALLDSGHRLHITLAQLNRLCPVVGSVLETYYGFVRSSKAYGDYYLVSSRWVKLTAL